MRSSTYYFAATYARHAEMRERRRELLAALPAAEVTSRWIDCHNGELEASYTPAAMAADPQACWRHGRDDLADLNRARTIVSFTGDPTGSSKGGRHVEHGYAIASGKGLVIIGAAENIFHTAPGTRVYATFAEFVAAEAAGV